MERQIARLPGSVVSHLRSSTILSNVAQIVEELVCNSLDAEAKQINIAIDGEACYLKVEDDGRGISRDDLTLVGERHATSKLQSLKELEDGVPTFGFRGEALSSLSYIALVEITSRCRGTPNVYRKILKGCATVSIGLSGEQRQIGTTVIVRDIFYNQPVRRRLLDFSDRKIIQSVKERVIRFVLIHPQVSFIFRDLSRKDLLLHTKRAENLRGLLSDIFGEDLSGRLQEIDFKQGHLRLKGFVSKTFHCHPSKAVQYIYINHRYVIKTAIHKLLNKDTTGIAKYSEELGRKDLSFGKCLYPLFVLDIICPFADYDITFEPSKTLVEFKDWDPVISLVKNVVQTVWRHQTVDRKKDCLHPSALAKASSDNFKSQFTDSKGHTRREKDNSSLAFHKAFIQGHSGVLVDSFKNSDQPQTTSTNNLPPVHLPGKKNNVSAPSFEVNYKAKRINDKQMESQTNWDRNDKGRCLPREFWLMTQCKQQGISNQVEVPLVHSEDMWISMTPGSDWLTEDMDCILQEFKEHDQFSTGKTLLTRSRNDRSSPYKMSKKQPRKSGPNPDAWSSKKSNCLSSIVDKNHGKTWYEQSNSKQKIIPLSSSDDSTNIFRIKDTSDFVNNCCLERVPPIFEWERSDPDSKNIESEYKRTSRTQNRRKRLKFITNSDGSSLDDWGYAKSIGSSPKFYQRPQSFQINSPDFDYWNMNTECSEDRDRHCLEDVFQETGGDISRGTLGDQCVTLSPCADDIQVNLDDLWLEKRLDVNYEDVTENLEYKTDCEKNQNSSKQQKSRDASPERSSYIERGCSGPPFYRLPRRHGVHMNPPSSLSTTGQWRMLADFKTFCTSEIGPRIEVQSKASQSSRRRGRSMRRLSVDTVCMSSLREEPKNGEDGVKLSCNRPEPSASNYIQAKPSMDKNLLGIAKANEAYCNLVKEDILQFHKDAHPCHGSKCRSTDFTSVGIVESELPKETFEEIFKEWSNPCVKRDDEILDLCSGLMTSNSSSLLPGSITKDIFKSIRVLQQVDTKFIASVSHGILLLFDQHAVDERVRLEELRRDVLDKNCTRQISLLSSAQELTLASAEEQMFQTYCKQIENWGWRFDTTTGKQSLESRRLGMSSGGFCSVLLSAVPCILGVRLTAADFTEYLQQLIDTEGSSAPPPAVVRLLSNKACRGAIMFGDVLLPAECNQLIEHLKNTLLCFQCAHGRPTMVPLVNLRALQEWCNFSTSGRTKTSMDFPLPAPKNDWHRLRNTVKPTLERARARLKQAQRF